MKVVALAVVEILQLISFNLNEYNSSYGTISSRSLMVGCAVFAVFPYGAAGSC